MDFIVDFMLMANIYFYESFFYSLLFWIQIVSKVYIFYNFIGNGTTTFTTNGKA